MPAGPHFQPLIVLPPSVLATSAVVESIIGVNSRELAVALVSPPKLATLPTTVITPFVPADPLATYLVG